VRVRVLRVAGGARLAGGSAAVEQAPEVDVSAARATATGGTVAANGSHPMAVPWDHTRQRVSSVREAAGAVAGGAARAGGAAAAAVQAAAAKVGSALPGRSTARDGGGETPEE